MEHLAGAETQPPSPLPPPSASMLRSSPCPPLLPPLQTRGRHLSPTPFGLARCWAPGCQGHKAPSLQIIVVPVSVPAGSKDRGCGERPDGEATHMSPGGGGGGLRLRETRSEERYLRQAREETPTGPLQGPRVALAGLRTSPHVWHHVRPGTCGSCPHPNCLPIFHHTPAPSGICPTTSTPAPTPAL